MVLVAWWTQRRTLCVADWTVYLGDDLGTQRGPLISLAMAAQVLMPLYRRIGEHIHAAGAIFCMHCCGAIHDLISHFIDAGVDVMNPLQPCVPDTFCLTTSVSLAVRARSPAR